MGRAWEGSAVIDKRRKGNGHVSGLFFVWVLYLLYGVLRWLFRLGVISAELLAFLRCY